jgi:LemA family protein
MKLFLIVFAAILAAGAILLSGGIYAKARLDEWERAKLVYATQAATASAAATVPPASSSYALKAELRHTAIEREREYVSILEKNKPFGIPLTAVEQQELKAVKADIAKLTDETDQELNQRWAAVLHAYQRRADLSLNLVNSVADAANFDQSMFVEVTNVRTSVGRAQMQLDPNKAPTDAAQLEQFEYAQGQLSNALSRLLLVIESVHPEWRANQIL